MDNRRTFYRHPCSYICVCHGTRHCLQRTRPRLTTHVRENVCVTTCSHSYIQAPGDINKILISIAPSTNLCSPKRRRWSSQLNSLHNCGCRSCSHTSVLRGSRRYLSHTRPRLMIQVYMPSTNARICSSYAVCPRKPVYFGVNFTYQWQQAQGQSQPIHQHTQTHLCSPYPHRIPNQPGNRRRSYPRAYLCICVCCRTRHFRSHIRLHLIMQCMAVAKNAHSSLPNPTRLSTVLNSCIHNIYIGAETWSPRTHSRHKPLQPSSPSLTHPAGQSPHLTLPAKFMHLRLLSHPPLLFKHSSTSDHTGVCGYAHK